MEKLEFKLRKVRSKKNNISSNRFKKILVEDSIRRPFARRNNPLFTGLSSPNQISNRKLLTI